MDATPPTPALTPAKSLIWSALLFGLAVAAAVTTVRQPVAAQGGAQALPAAPTFNKDVAPILHAHCATCHRADGIAPMSLLTHEEAAAWAQQVKDMVVSRAMPPWYADPKFGQFKNARGLTDAQIQTLTRWVDLLVGEGDCGPCCNFPCSLMERMRATSYSRMAR